MKGSFQLSMTNIHNLGMRKYKKCQNYDLAIVNFGSSLATKCFCFIPLGFSGNRHTAPLFYTDTLTRERNLNMLKFTGNYRKHLELFFYKYRILHYVTLLTIVQIIYYILYYVAVEVFPFHRF